MGIVFSTNAHFFYAFFLRIVRFVPVDFSPASAIIFLQSSNVNSSGLAIVFGRR
jgi:hypothetical protein